MYTNGESYKEKTAPCSHFVFGRINSLCTNRQKLNRSHSPVCVSKSALQLIDRYICSFAADHFYLWIQCHSVSASHCETQYYVWITKSLKQATLEWIEILLKEQLLFFIVMNYKVWTKSSILVGVHTRNLSSGDGNRQHSSSGSTVQKLSLHTWLCVLVLPIVKQCNELNLPLTWN